LLYHVLEGTEHMPLLTVVLHLQLTRKLSSYIFNTSSHTRTKSYYNKFNHCHTSGRTYFLLQEGADKSLARPGKKQTTVTSLGIYSTYFPQSSIHFLARCSNFCKPLKKRIRRLSVQPGLRGSNDPRVGRKMATFQLFFQSRELVVV